MLPELRHQINRAAERYAQMVHIGDEMTALGHERWGKLMGLLWVWRYLHDNQEAVIGMAHREVEAAQVRLGYIDEEGYAVEGAA